MARKKWFRKLTYNVPHLSSNLVKPFTSFYQIQLQFCSVCVLFCVQSKDYSMFLSQGFKRKISHRCPHEDRCGNVNINFSIAHNIFIKFCKNVGSGSEGNLLFSTQEQHQTNWFIDKNLNTILSATNQHAIII